MNEKPTILVLAFTDLSRDARIRRQLRALSQKYHVMAVGNKNPEMTGVAFIPTGFHEKTMIERIYMYSAYIAKRYEAGYWHPFWIQSLGKTLAQNSQVDLIIANDVDTLPLAFALKSRCGVLLDAHEYAPREFEESAVWRLLFGGYKDYLCRAYIAKTAGCITVAPGIAKEYEKIYSAPFDVLTNAPAYQTVSPHTTEEKWVELVHHGAALPGRGLELMVKAMHLAEQRFHLHFYLVGNEKYIRKLKKMAKGLKRIHFHAPVAADSITEVLQSYDIGLSLIQPTNFNWEHCLPNKFFEFVQARLAVVIGPSVEMRPYMEKYNLGITCESFAPEELAKRLNCLSTEEIDLYKKNSEEAASFLCAEKNARQLQKHVAAIFERKHPLLAVPERKEYVRHLWTDRSSGE